MLGGRGEGMRVLAHVIYRETDPARNAWMGLAFSLDLGIIDERG